MTSYPVCKETSGKLSMTEVKLLSNTNNEPMSKSVIENYLWRRLAEISLIRNFQLQENLIMSETMQNIGKLSTKH